MDVWSQHPDTWKGQGGDVVVELKETNLLTRHPCHACGGCTDKVNVLAEVPSGEHDGLRVCERCLEAGDIDERLENHADRLESYAANLRTLIGRLRVPTYAEWQAAMEAYEAAWIEAYEREVGPLPESVR